jgi:hypothetical protein
MAEQIALEGKTTVDDKMVFEPQRLSYEAARSIAEKIARRISGRTRDRHVVIAGTQLLADLSNVVATKSVLEELAGEYDSLARAVSTSTSVVPLGHYYSRGRQTEYVQLAVPSFDTISAGVKGAFTLLSLFRQDVDYTGVPVSIDTLGFEIELAARIRMHKAKEVLIPDVAVLHVVDVGASAMRASIERVKSARSACISAMSEKAAKEPKASKPWRPFEHLLTRNDLEVQHREGDERGGDAEQGMIEHGIVEPLPERPDLTEIVPPPAPRLDVVLDVLAQIDQRYNDLESSLAKMDPGGTGLTVLARLLRAESLSARAPMLVHARVLTAGGSNRVSRSLFRTMFTGDGLSSCGGAVVSWAILSEHGAVEDGGIFTESMSANSPKPPDIPHSIP